MTVAHLKALLSQALSSPKLPVAMLVSKLPKPLPSPLPQHHSRRMGMSEMVERVTNAIYDAMDIADSLAVPEAERYARAAIKAMREATYPMLLEGQGVVNLSEEVGRFEFISRDECQEIWETMIDEALK